MCAAAPLTETVQAMLLHPALAALLHALTDTSFVF